MGIFSSTLLHQLWKKLFLNRKPFLCCTVCLFCTLYNFKYCNVLSINTLLRHIIPALNVWAAGHNTRPCTRLLFSFHGMGALMTSQLNDALISMLRGLFVGLIVDKHVLPMCVFTTRYLHRRPVDWCIN